MKIFHRPQKSGFPGDKSLGTGRCISVALDPRQGVLKRVADGREAVHDSVEVIACLVARDDCAGVVSQFLDLVHGVVLLSVGNRVQSLMSMRSIRQWISSPRLA